MTNPQSRASSRAGRRTHHELGGQDQGEGSDEDLPQSESTIPNPEPTLPNVRSDLYPPTKTQEQTRLLAHYAGLVLATMIGCLIRLGLNALANYDGRAIFPLAWAQGVGCGIMGLALGKKDELERLYPPLYTFITTGIAGSVTTFSSWMLESFLAFSNESQYNRGGLHDTVDGLGYSFATWLMALGALHIGFHFSSIIPLPKLLSSRSTSTTSPTGRTGSSPCSSNTEKKRNHPRPKGLTPWLDVLTILSAFLAYLVALLLYFFAPRSWRHPATFPILLGPPGTILRYALAKFNPQPRFQNRFPIGTFIANILGTIVISAAYVGQRLPATRGGTRCNALYAVQQGFCGSLTTASTFVVESRTIKRKRDKWIYVGGSVISGHVVVLAIVGGVRWSRGLEPVCG